MRGCKNGKIRYCLRMLTILMLLVAIGMLSGCKKKEEYRNIRITEITGDVTVNRDEKTGIKAYVNMNLQSEDELVTAKGRLTYLEVYRCK